MVGQEQENVNINCAGEDKRTRIGYLRNYLTPIGLVHPTMLAERASCGCCSGNFSWQGPGEKVFFPSLLEHCTSLPPQSETQPLTVRALKTWSYQLASGLNMGATLWKWVSG